MFWKYMFVRFIFLISSHLQIYGKIVYFKAEENLRNHEVNWPFAKRCLAWCYNVYI